MNHLNDTIKKIERDMGLIGGIQNINVHIQNPGDPEDKSYIEFKATSREYERAAQELYFKYSKIIRNNHPQLSISYNNPHAHHENNLLRRILIEFHSDIKDSTQKKELLAQAAEDFHYIVKRWVKYPKVKKTQRKNKSKKH